MPSSSLVEVEIEVEVGLRLRLGLRLLSRVGGLMGGWC